MHLRKKINYQISMKIKLADKNYCNFVCDLQKTLTLWQKNIAWQ
jgi:hypothetical protein